MMITHDSRHQASRSLSFIDWRHIHSATLFLGLAACDPDADRNRPDLAEATDTEDPGESSGGDPAAFDPIGGLTDRLHAQGFTWGNWVGFETTPDTCAANAITSGAACLDSCSFIRPECHAYGGTLGSSHWESFFSEELPNERLCPGANEYVTGVACKGWWCDDVALECTQTPYAKNSCYWTGAVSNGSYLAPWGQGIVGMRCLGGYCSSMEYRVCNLW
jgi:hypothetical protein